MSSCESGNRDRRPVRRPVDPGGQPDPYLWDRPPGVGFEYDRLPEPLHCPTRERAAEIHKLLGPRLMIRTGHDVVFVGLALKAVRDTLGRKDFAEWLAAEFQWQPRGVAKLIRSATVFQTADCLDNLQPKAMHVLSRKVVPEEALAEALELARAGKRITRSRAEWIVRFNGDVSIDIDDARSACSALERAVDRIMEFPGGITPNQVQGLIERIVNVQQAVDLLWLWSAVVEQTHNEPRTVEQGPTGAAPRPPVDNESAFFERVNVVTTPFPAEPTASSWSETPGELRFP